MSKSIRISKKHGLNPTIPVCFWCGEEKQEIALMGHVSTKDNNDFEMPMRCVINYEPCEKCAAAWKNAVIILETTEKDIKRPAISKNNDKNIYPTGSLVGITEDAASRIFEHDYKFGEVILLDEKPFKTLFADAISESKER